MKRTYRFRVRITFETEVAVEAHSAGLARSLAERWARSPWVNKDPDRLTLANGLKVVSTTLKALPKE